MDSLYSKIYYYNLEEVLDSTSFTYFILYSQTTYGDDVETILAIICLRKFLRTCSIKHNFF